MNFDTPLLEVIAHLPRSIALQLHEQQPSVQRVALRYIRASVARMEEGGLKLDPISYDVLLEVVGQLSYFLATADDLLVRTQLELSETRALLHPQEGT